MAVVRSSWTARHGDTSKSAIWAVLSNDGQPIDLTDWTVRAQLRPSLTDSNVVHVFTGDEGVLTSTAMVQLDNGRLVSTATVQLVLTPVDWNEIPAGFSGILDVEIASDATPDPDETYTVALVDFYADVDVTRWYDPTNTGGDGSESPYSGLQDAIDAVSDRVAVLEGQPPSSTGSVRPSAGVVGSGAQFYDTTLSKPIWSDGTVWRDSAGSTV